MRSLGVLCVSYLVLYGTVGTDGSAPGECSDVNPLKISFPALMQFQSQPFSVIFSPRKSKSCGKQLKESNE